MAPISLFVATAFLALGGVEASDKVRVSQWISTDCIGDLARKQDEFKLGKCESINAQSFKLHYPEKNRHGRWVNSRPGCVVTTYSTAGCVGGTEVGTFPIPEDFEECKRPSPGGVRSLKFTCGSKAKLKGSVSTSTYTLSSYSLGPDGRASNVQSTITSTLKGSSKFDVQRGEPTAVADPLEPRGASARKYEMKGVWMKHPWAGSPVCYECWLAKKGNKDKFECEAGRDHSDSICGAPRPDQYVVTQTRSIAGTTVTTTMTGIAVIATPAPLHGALDERSTKKRVWIQHPFSGVMTCGKAKWKHAGKDKQSIIIKGPESCRDKEQYPVNLSPSVATRTISGVTSTFTSITLVSGTISTIVVPTLALPTTSYSSTSTATVTISLPTVAPSNSRVAAVADLWNQ
ncbi:hypothetical protein K491DRAFT_719168 [Lophiostoma macrostomum CBS 122681]|uniref:Lytic polysaccharide monooxygenase n=1 Tax=Lophiostoma macrostomum CBS 122681 TaxID=1314788 RepID=A0A6A6SYN9_9PLEO|nr:hypothetical protein K491DRAFT_719168 [Lophiostoma macrostomum CBS 122681]